MKLQLKRSLVVNSPATPGITASGLAKVPNAGQMKWGELAVNYCKSDPTIFMLKDNGTPTGEVVEPYFKKNSLQNLQSI